MSAERVETDIAVIQKEVMQAGAFVPAMRREIASVLVGQASLVDALLIGLITNGHVLVEGVPGLAKTLAIRTLAETIGGSFSRIQFTPDLLPADLTGTSVYHPGDHTFSIRKGPVFANIILADEVNRAPAKVQSALLEAMQERQVTIGGETHPLPKPFLVMATQNPIEQEGTYPLPEAQIDRFMLKALVTYPTRDQERDVLERMAHPNVDLHARQVADSEIVMNARASVDRIYLDEKVREYILDLVLATRPGCRQQLGERQRDARLGQVEQWIEYGASPRASLALALAAKAKAFLDGRAYVVPQDVKDVALMVLRHRVVPTYEAEAENLTADMIVQRLLDELRTP